MIAEAAAKTAPATLPPLAAALAYAGMDGHFFLKTIAVLFGIGFGAMWRAGLLRSEGKPWVAVRGDLTISALIGGGNAVLSLGIVEIFGFGALLAMGTGVLFGATGLRALPTIKNAAIGMLQRWALGENVALISPKDPALDKLARDVDSLPPTDPPTDQP